MESLDVFVDESGSIGHDKRYFVLCAICVDTIYTKKVKRHVKRIEKKLKRDFSQQLTNQNEVKAANMCPYQKEYFVRKISTEDYQAYFIICDLYNVSSQLINGDKNLLYNFLCKFMFKDILRNRKSLKNISITFDNRTTKITSRDSLQDYLKIAILYEMQYDDLKIEVKMEDSTSNLGLHIADFYANEAFCGYNYPGGCNKHYGFKHLENVKRYQKFPFKNFGK